MLRPLDWLAWLLSLAVWIGFFLPWVKLPRHPESIHARRSVMVAALDSEASRSPFSVYLSLTPEEWKRAVDGTSMEITGWEIPEIYREHSNRRAIVAINSSLLLGEERQKDRAQFAYAIPVLAFLSAAFITAARSKSALLLPLLTNVVLYTFIRYKLNLTYLDRLATSIDVGLGLWLCLYALLGLTLLLALRLVLPANTRL